MTRDCNMSHQPNNIFAGTQVVSIVEARGPNYFVVYQHALSETKLVKHSYYEARMGFAQGKERNGLVVFSDSFFAQLQ